MSTSWEVDDGDSEDDAGEEEDVRDGEAEKRTKKIQSSVSSNMYAISMVHTLTLETLEVLFILMVYVPRCFCPSAVAFDGGEIS